MIFDMDLDQCSLEDFRNFNYELYHQVIDLLNEENKWKNVLSALSRYRFYCMYRLRISLPLYKIRKIELARSPAEYLLNELIIKTCSLNQFKELLRCCDLTDILTILSDPEMLKIVQQPGDDEEKLYIFYNNELYLECQATGLPPPKYQWFVDNVALENQNKPVLRLPNFSLENEGNYYCLVSQEVGDTLYELESNTLEVYLMDVLPEFVQQPPLKIVKRTGSDLLLIVEVSCHSRYNLQWMFNNRILRGETSDTLTLKNITRSSCGKYRCMASNSAGEVYTIPTELTVEGELIRPTAKVALLIANERYENFPTLSTPINDVVLLHETLTKLKFRVITLVNLDRNEMENTIKWFFELTPPKAYAIICFVGHGFMLSNCKYMMPIDCPKEYRIQDCICDDLLVKNAKENNLTLLLLMSDMCLGVPNSEDNPQIFHERAPDYIYSFNGACHVVRVCSTTNLQKAYEYSNRMNGLYVEHISKYITRDGSIGENFIAAHKAFEEKKSVIKLQKPSISFEGGYNIKLYDKARENPEFLSKFEAVNKLCNVHELNFSQIGFKTNLYVKPHRNILNVLDLHFLPVFDSWEIKLHLSPPKAFLMRSNHNMEGGGCIVTLFNIQKAISDIFFTVLLKDLQNSTSNFVASATLDLGMPLFAAAKVWCNNSSNEESLS